jgi:nitrite reductase/ring-hydroxylating ferredoxin subunit
VWENVHDWEHLPWLHRTTFCDIELLDRGGWGWRARVGLQPAEQRTDVVIDLRIARGESRYCAATIEGPGSGTEIWTRLQPVDEKRTDIEVEFLVPGVAPDQAEAYGAFYVDLYTRLWDEDEAMMRRRADLLGNRSRQKRGLEAVDLGPLDELKGRLPLVVGTNGRSFRIVLLDGEVLAHPTTCPHMLGPLENAALEAGCVRCPWHGYRFDLRDGRCLDDGDLKLDPLPRVAIDETARAQLRFD